MRPNRLCSYGHQRLTGTQLFSGRSALDVAPNAATSTATVSRWPGDSARSERSIKSERKITDGREVHFTVSPLSSDTPLTAADLRPEEALPGQSGV
jgi:hypothetical protein